jgi:hybrid cluster-associated redox disulfide protein
VNKKKEKHMKTTKNTLISEAINANPKTAQIMLEHGLYCLGCGRAQNETIEQGAKAHGMTDKQIKELLSEINEAQSEKK